MSLPIILAFGAMIGWGVADFLIQRTIKKIGWLETLWWIFLGSFIFIFPLIYKSLTNLNGYKFLILITLAVVSFFGSLTQFKALEIGKLSVIEAILFFELPLTILLGILFLNNKLLIYQIVLIFILFIGVVLISIDFQKIRSYQFWFFWKRTKFFWEKGTLLAIATAILFALTNFFTAVGATDISPWLVIWFPWTLGGLVCLSYLLYKRRGRSLIRDGRHYWVLILTMVIIDIGAWLCFSQAIARAGELAIIASITEGYIVIAMLLGFKFNQEKIRGWQYLGAGLTIMASILIGLSGR